MKGLSTLCRIKGMSTPCRIEGLSTPSSGVAKVVIALFKVSTTRLFLHPHCAGGEGGGVPGHLRW